ncbi:MAG: hypothetical protein V1911_02385 [Candidatus Micrarchaeota archaeon]
MPDKTTARRGAGETGTCRNRMGPAERKKRTLEKYKRVSKEIEREQRIYLPRGLPVRNTEKLREKILVDLVQGYKSDAGLAEKLDIPLGVFAKSAAGGLLEGMIESGEISTCILSGHEKGFFLNPKQRNEIMRKLGIKEEE